MSANQNNQQPKAQQGQQAQNNQQGNNGTKAQPSVVTPPAPPATPATAAELQAAGAGAGAGDDAAAIAEANAKAAKAVPSDPAEVAIALANRLAAHFADRSDLSTINSSEFLTIAQEVGMVEKTEYDPKKHQYLKKYADSRNIVAGGEIVAYTDAGEQILVQAAKLEKPKAKK